MTPARRLLVLLPLLHWLARAGAAPESANDAPVKIAGVVFERHVTVAGVELRLNGVGVRGWYKAYAAGLYLNVPAATASEVVAAAGPKRLQLRVRYNLPADEFVKALRVGMSRNVAPAQLPQLTARMDRFGAMIGALNTVHDGDVVNLDFEPGRGLVFTVNGSVHGEPIPGEDFYAALLLAFVGDKPYDQKLKAGLLGATG